VDPGVAGPMIEAALDGVMLQAIAEGVAVRVSCERLRGIVERVLQTTPG
jgi:hypothetical protein